MSQTNLRYIGIVCYLYFPFVLAISAPRFPILCARAGLFPRHNAASRPLSRALFSTCPHARMYMDVRAPGAYTSTWSQRRIDSIATCSALELCEIRIRHMFFNSRTLYHDKATYCNQVMTLIIHTSELASPLHSCEKVASGTSRVYNWFGQEQNQPRQGPL